MCIKCGNPDAPHREIARMGWFPGWVYALVLINRAGNQLLVAVEIA